MRGVLCFFAAGMGWAAVTGSSLGGERNASTVVLVTVGFLLLAWFAGRRRGIAIASASATASAVAAAHATSEAMASATGGSVNLQVVLPGALHPVEVERFRAASQPRHVTPQEQALLELDPDLDPEDALERVMDSSEEAVHAAANEHA